MNSKKWCITVFCAALLSVLCEKNPLLLSLSPEDIESIEALLCGKSRDELHFYLSHAASKLFSVLTCDEALVRYMTGALSLLLPSFENAIRYHTLGTLCGVK